MVFIGVDQKLLIVQPDNYIGCLQKKFAEKDIEISWELEHEKLLTDMIF